MTIEWPSWDECRCRLPRYREGASVKAEAEVVTARPGDGRSGHRQTAEVRGVAPEGAPPRDGRPADVGLDEKVGSGRDKGKGSTIAQL
jgi:hypothetical protein